MLARKSLLAAPAASRAATVEASRTLNASCSAITSRTRHISYSPIPPTVRVLFVVLGLAAAIRLTRRWTDPRLGPELYMLWVLFAVDSLREALAGVLGIEQVILVLEMLAGIAVITYSLRVGGLRRLSPEPTRMSGRF